jgi:hypothetical protein
MSNGLNFAVNRTIPIKFTLTDYQGNAITSLSAVTSLQLQALDSNGNPVGAPFNPASTNNQGLQYTGGQYLFNWQSKGMTPGSYEIVLKLADGTTTTKTLQLTGHGSGSNAQAADGSDVSGDGTAGQLLGGNVELYVDNSNGDLTPDELARIQDAVNGVDATIAPFGVAINEATDPTQADVTLNMGTNSAVGGYSQGILGCYTTTGTITLIQGWNWYAGSDPTLIGTNQYDFQTTVTHELGHALGLGESSAPTSAMSGTLAPGTVIRTLTTADLNVPYDEATADPQRAGVPLPTTAVFTPEASPGSPPAAAVSDLLANARSRSAAAPRFVAFLDVWPGKEFASAGTTGSAAGPESAAALARTPFAASTLVPVGGTGCLSLAAGASSGGDTQEYSSVDTGRWHGLQGDEPSGLEPASGCLTLELICLALDQASEALWLPAAPPADSWLPDNRMSPAQAVEELFSRAEANQLPLPTAVNAHQSEAAQAVMVDAGWAWAGILGLLWNMEILDRRDRRPRGRRPFTP